MSSEPPSPDPAAQQANLDPAQLLYLRQRLESEQNLPLALLAGSVAAAAGAGLWALVTVATGYQIGFMAIGVGFLVGIAVRRFGKGMEPIYGILGGGFALLGCAAGNLLAVTALAAQAQGFPFLEALGQLDAELVRGLMTASFQPMDLLFYAIAVYEGYRLAFRQVGREEIEGLLGGTRV